MLVFAAAYRQLHPELPLQFCLSAVSTSTLAVMQRQSFVQNVHKCIKVSFKSMKSALAPQALTLALLPVHYFFTGLYYTDTGSTMLVRKG